MKHRRSHLRLQLVAPSRLVPPRVRREQALRRRRHALYGHHLGHGEPEYCCPCDIFKLCAGNDFTVDSDRDAVNSTLTKMLQAKAKVDPTHWLISTRRKGDITLSRMMQAMSPVFVPRHAYGSAAVGSEGSAIDRLKKFMKWRSDAEEAAWMGETGWNLLTFAAAMDDGPAVEELLAQDARWSACLPRRELTWCVRGTARRERRFGASRWGKSCWNSPKT